MKSYLILAAYIFFTTFSPGPNNITSTSAGVQIGLKRSLPYLSGIVSGVFIVILLSGLLNQSLLNRYGQYLDIIKWIGFVYLLYLSVSLFIKSESRVRAISNYSYFTGFLLQLVNPKLMLYGITIFGMFSSILVKSSITVIVWSLILSIICFLSTLTWCSIGAFLSKVLMDSRNRLIFNSVLAVFLIYTAFSIIR